MRRAGVILCVVGCALAGCSDGGGNAAGAANMVDVNAVAAQAQDDIDDYAAVSNAVANESDAGNAGGAASTAAPADDATPQAAADAARRYFAAIGAGRYADAWLMWAQDGAASGMSADAFAVAYARYARYAATVGTPGRSEGAAGHVYVTLPVTVTGALKTGGAVRMEGPVVMVRVNDGIETTDPADHLWHVHSSDLKPRP